MQYAEVLKLGRDSFMELIELSPAAKYTFQVVKDVLISGNFFELGICCYLCREFTHLARNCTNLRLKIDKEEIQRKWLVGGRKKAKSLRNAISEGPNYCRKSKRAHIGKAYALRNVSASATSTPLYLQEKLPLVPTAPLSIPIFEPEPLPKPLDMIPTTERSLLPEDEEHSDEDYSPVAAEGRQKRFSVFRGVKTYALKNSRGFMARGSVSG